MKSDAAKILFAYWNKIRGSRVAPQRFEVEPVNIAGILPETFILEYGSPKSVHFRLAGTSICDIFAKEFRGQSIYGLWDNADRVAVEDAIVSLANTGSVAVISAKAVTKSEKEFSAEITMMPLLHSANEINRIIGTITMAPTDLNWETRLDPVQSLHITDSEQLWPDGRPHNLLSKTARAPLLPPKIVTSNNRRFRVFEGGRSHAQHDHRN